jgi:hypothetical protein
MILQKVAVFDFFLSIALISLSTASRVSLAPPQINSAHTTSGWRRKPRVRKYTVWPDPPYMLDKPIFDERLLIDWRVPSSLAHSVSILLDLEVG